jgi:hypothetical protein
MLQGANRVLNESALSPCREPVLMRGDSVLANERPRQMALIAEPSARRSFGEAAPGTHEPLRELEPYRTQCHPFNDWSRAPLGVSSGVMAAFASANFSISRRSG